MFRNTSTGRERTDPATSTTPESHQSPALSRSGRRRAETALARDTSRSWSHKIPLALAAAGMVAAFAFPQVQTGAEPDRLEAASSVTKPLTASTDADVKFSRAELTSTGAEDNKQDTEASVKTASNGSVEKLSEPEKIETKPDPAGLSAPLPRMNPTSSFGYRTSPISGTPGEFHSGQDFSGSCGTSVHSAAAGTVTEAGWHPFGGGNRVTVDHGNGMETTYNHLSSISVSAGQTVGSDVSVGNVGSTGASTGCHLHFEVVLNGAPVDPLGFL